jgi:glycosyltransferase involved in cell wall biosynthesis
VAEPVAFILKGYPRLSETFIAQEIRALEARGLPIRIVSLRHPTDIKRHPVHDEIAAPVLYLPEYLHDEPLRVARAAVRAVLRPGFRRALSVWWRDVRRDPSRNRVRRFGQALVLAAELPAGVAALHAHFLHTPASVARYAALLSGLPWSCSAHAKDIWTIPDWEKREKLADMAWLTTCTAAGADHLRALAPGAAIDLNYHGLDFSRFPPPPEGTRQAGGDGRNRPVTILSVGRIVPKKGYDVLLRALAGLDPDLRWRFVHVGGGGRADLGRLAGALGIAGAIDWRGAQAQADVLQAMREADIFVLASRIGDDGDRDGLPNVLMEAQSQALPCLATDVSGIPELIVDGETGILVPPDDCDALAAALAALIADPARRHALGRAGLARLHARFDMNPLIDRLARRFGLPGDMDLGTNLDAAAE